MVKRGEVWLAALDPTVGHEIQKTRPSLIISPDQLNGRLRTVIVAPMTSKGRPAPFRVPTRFKGKDGLILPEQIRVLDQSRLVRRIGRTESSTLQAVLRVLREMFED